MEKRKTEGRGKNYADLKNCGHCPQYMTECKGNDMSCLCRKCPRNLGQCLTVRYCRETESVLDNIYPGDKRDEEIRILTESYFKTME